MLRLSLSFIFIFLVLPDFVKASDLALQIQQMSAQIQMTTDPQQRQRMQQRLEKRMTPKFEQQMRNAQNNIYRSLRRMGKHLLTGQFPAANMEIKTFEKHLARFEKLARAGKKLPKYQKTTFELRISKGTGMRTSYLTLKASPSMSSLYSSGSPMDTRLRRFIAKFGFLAASRADKNNTTIRTPPSSSGAKKSGAPRKTPDILNPGAPSVAR